MRRRVSWPGGLIVTAVALASIGIHAQRTAPDDLQGIWNYATMTPLERPRDLAAKASLTPAEAADYERQTLERQASTNNTAGPDWWPRPRRRSSARPPVLRLVERAAPPTAPRIARSTNAA
jgi:hypothetical protein